MDRTKLNFRNDFLRSSTIVLVGSTLANAVNYLYNLILGRILEPAAYGEVAAYVTLAMIVVVPSATLAVLVTKYVSEYSALGLKDKVASVYKSSMKVALIIGSGMFVVFLILSPFISSYLKTSLTPTLIFAFLLPLSLIAASSKGTLQGLHDFSSLSYVNVIEAVGKILFAVLFVYVGWGVAGAVGGILSGGFAGFLFSALKLKHKFQAMGQFRKVTGNWFPSIPHYTYIVFFSTLFLSVFGNIDVVLAKHYLPEHDAGQYAALAVLGRIITYGSIAVITVLLPMAAAAKASNDVRKSRKLLGASLGVTVLVSFFILLFFVFLPELTVRVLFGSEYLEVAKYLSLFGVVMLLGSLSKIFINFFLATHENKFVFPFGLISAIQVILIFFYHDSIRAIINVLLTTNVLLLLSMAAIYLISHNQTVVDEPPITNLNNA